MKRRAEQSREQSREERSEKESRAEQRTKQRRGERTGDERTGEESVTVIQAEVSCSHLTSVWQTSKRAQCHFVMNAGTIKSRLGVLVCACCQRPLSYKTERKLQASGFFENHSILHITALSAGDSLSAEMMRLVW